MRHAICSAAASALFTGALYAGSTFGLFGCQGHIQPPSDVPAGMHVEGVPDKNAKPAAPATSAAPAVPAPSPSAPAAPATTSPTSRAPAEAPAPAVKHEEKAEAPRRIELKAFSKDEVRGLREGRALDFAVVAEKNHYPAPYYALRLVSQMALFEDQIAPLKAIYAALNGRTRSLGAQLLDQEARIERYFEDQENDPEKLERLVRESARLRGEIRLLHLQADIETRKIVKPGQLVNYEAERGRDPAEDGKECK